MKPSNRFTLNRADVEKWVKNAATFLAPAALIFLVAIQSGVPLKDALLAVYTWGLSTAIDLLRKYIAGK